MKIEKNNACTIKLHQSFEDSGEFWTVIVYKNDGNTPGDALLMMGSSDINKAFKEGKSSVVRFMKREGLI